MQKITLARTAGFCFGVDRAVRLLEKLLREGRSVCTLGPIIHNPQVTEYFGGRGVRVVSKPEECRPGDVLVLRTHGVPKELLERAKAFVPDCCDAVCPFVTKIHRIVGERSLPGNVTLIAGDAQHPEVIGIRSCCRGTSYVFNSEAELEDLIREHPDLSKNGLILVSQTTFSTKIFEKCAKKIKLVYTNAVIFDTICSATEERQKEAAQLSLLNDAMVIVGGRRSSNTAKLKAVCESNCPTFLIESADELKDIDLSAFRSVGVTAGASTPDSIIKEVLKTMSENSEEIRNTAVGKGDPLKASGDNFADLFEDYIDSSSDQKVTGRVVAVTPTEIQVELTGRKHAGYIPLNEYSSDPEADPQKELKPGDLLDLLIMKTNDQEGLVMLSKRRYDAAKAWNDLADSANEVREGLVTGIVGDGKGIFVQYGGIRIFVPASLAKASRSDTLENMIDKTVRFKIIEVDRKRRRVVGSVKAAARDLRREAEKAFWDQAEEGQIYHGIVRSLTSYGAFVDVGGVDGMVHVSELSWTRIKHPSEVVRVGDSIEVYIKGLDRERGRISLGYRKIEDSPWEILRRDFPVGRECEAKIVGLTSFGAFANLLPGIDGLIYISEIAHKRIENPAEVLKLGDIVKVKILNIDFVRKRVSLSRKALLKASVAEEMASVPAEEPAEAPADEPAEAPAEEPAEVPAEEPAEVPADEPAEAPADEPAEVPAEEPAEVPAEEPAEVPAEEPAEVPAEEPAEAPAEEPAEVPADEPAEVPAEEPAEVSAEEPSEAPAEKPVEE